MIKKELRHTSNSYRYNGNHFSCMYTNADTLTNKMEELRLRVSSEKERPEFIMINEVKPKNQRYLVTQAELKINGYEMFSNIANNDGRGLIIYIRSNIMAREVRFKANFQESLWVEVHLKDGDLLLIGCIYRSPSSVLENNSQLINLIKEVARYKPTHILITGDFNYPRIDWENWTSEGEEHSEEFRFVEALRDSYMYQHVTGPTRARGSDRPKLLDLVFTNEEGMVEDLRVTAPLGKSDHSVLEFKYNAYTDKKATLRKIFLYDKGDYNDMRMEVTQDWRNQILEIGGIDEKWCHIRDKIKELEEHYVPIKVNKDSDIKKRKLALDAVTLEAIRKKHRCWQRYMETHEMDKYRAFTQQRNKVKKLIQRARKMEERGIAKEAAGKPKKFWSFVKEKLKTKSGIAELREEVNGEVKFASSDEDKARVLSEFFGKVFTVEPDLVDLPEQVYNVPQPMPNIEIAPEDVLGRLQKLKVDKSPGPDNVHPRILKELREELKDVLVDLFNTSLREGKLPNEWKTANVSAIYKKGDKSEPSNYRPVSLTSVVCKVMETIVREKIMAHLMKHKLLSDKQFGFIPGRSTVLQMLHVMDEWTRILDEGGEVDVVYMDFQKAFDKVPHRRLLRKLGHYGITGNTQQWIRNFLVNRKQRVNIKGAYSSWRNVVSGVPQGSVLGPVLFAIYINELPASINSRIFLFADDTKIFRGINSQQDQIALQDDLGKLVNWSERNLLPFHPNKCSHLRVHTRHRTVEDTEYTLATEGSDRLLIKKIAKEEDLGITTDEFLNFEAHISKKVNKANQIMGLIRRAFSALDISMFRCLFKSMVRPHLEYAQSIWSPYKRKDIRMVENVLRRASKMLPGLKNLSYSERLRHLEIPTMAYRRHRGDMIEVFKILKGGYDEDVNIHLERQVGMTRGNILKLKKIRTRTQRRQMFFTSRVVDAWNSLPNSVIEAENVMTFEKRLDQFWANQPIKFDFEEKLITAPARRQL